MAAGFGITEQDIDKKLTKLVEDPAGFNIKITNVASAYNNVVNKNHVDVLNGKRM